MEAWLTMALEGRDAKAAWSARLLVRLARPCPSNPHLHESLGLSRIADAIASTLENSKPAERDALIALSLATLVEATALSGTLVAA